LDSGIVASMIPIASGGHTIDLSSVQLNLSSVELHTVQGLNISTKCEHSGGCDTFAGSPLVVDLTPGADAVTVSTETVPAGSYREIAFKVTSVHLVGTFDTKPFDVTVPVNIFSSTVFKPPIAIGDTTDVDHNITVLVSLTPWFMNADGSLIDPTKLATNSSLRSLVASRIQAAFRAFRDDNKNCKDDDNDEEEHHSGEHESGRK
jgi:hypothetical protein